MTNIYLDESFVPFPTVIDVCTCGCACMRAFVSPVPLNHFSASRPGIFQVFIEKEILSQATRARMWPTAAAAAAVIKIL